MRFFTTIIQNIYYPQNRNKDDYETNILSLLVRGASGTLFLKVASKGFAFLTSVMLVRLLGTAGYGAYAYAMAWVGVLSVFGIMGMDKLLVRNISAYLTNFEWGLIRGILQRSTQISLIASLLLIVIAGCVGWLYIDSDLMSYTFLLALLLLPFTVLNQLRTAVFRALNYIVIGQTPEMLIRPILFISLIGCSYYLLGSLFSAPLAIGLNILANATVLTIGTLMLYKVLPAEVKVALPEYETRTWLRIAMPMLFVAGMHVINAKTDIIMVGTLINVEASGIYTVATLGAELITFVLLSVNTPLGPIIARLYANNEITKLQHVITKGARLTLAFSLPMALGLIIFSKTFLLIFGVEFIKGQIPLIILSASQLINSTAGSVGVILLMTGHERLAALGVGISAIVNIILNSLFIPKWGLIGAATATALSIVVWNVILCWFVWRRLGINSTVIGRVR